MSVGLSDMSDVSVANQSHAGKNNHLNTDYFLRFKICASDMSCSLNGYNLDLTVQAEIDGNGGFSLSIDMILYI